MTSAETGTFNCTQCGAGLDLLGGGRVRVQVCSYCGAELDAQDEYRVIAQFRDMVRPHTPFDLGMEGTLWGVPFTVIGTIGWIEQYGSRYWVWTDHQIFSPTHGYGWLSVENGHITYTRKTRDVPEPASLTAAYIENAEYRPTVQLGSRTFRYYGSGTARPTFVEGAFNYVPSMNDRVRYAELLCGHRMLTIADQGNEREYEMTELPDRGEIVTSFGLDPARLPEPEGVHPLDVFEEGPNARFIRNTALLGGAVALLLGMVLAPMNDRILQTQRLPIDQSVALPFEVTRGDRLTRIDIWADASNSWASFEAVLYDAAGEPVSAFEREVGYYFGREGGESWSEGSRSVKTKVDLPAGAYTLEIERTDGQVDWTDGRLAREMQVTVSEGHTNPLWLFGVGALLLAFGGFFLSRRALHDRRRWAGSDWSDG